MQASSNNAVGAIARVESVDQDKGRQIGDIA